MRAVSACRTGLFHSREEAGKMVSVRKIVSRRRRNPNAKGAVKSTSTKCG